MATAKKLPSGSWRIQPYKKLADGTSIRVSITAPTKKEAERLASQWELDVEKQTLASSCTLKEALEQYLTTCKAQKLSPSTIRVYAGQIKHSYPDLMNKKVSALSITMIQAQFDKRAETVSPKTLRNDLNLLKCALKIHNPNLDLSRIKIIQNSKRPKLEMNEEWKIQIPSFIAKRWGKDDYYLYILLIIYAGLRPSESYALEWGDISSQPVIVKDNNGDEIKIGYIDISKACVLGIDSFEDKTTKTQSGIRLIKVSWSLIEEIESVHPRGKDNERIFKEDHHKKKTRWDTIRSKLNIPKNIRRYDMRHFYATSMVAAGATEEELQSNMGHLNSAFTHNIYVETFAEHKEKINIALAKNTSMSIHQIQSITSDTANNTPELE